MVQINDDLLMIRKDLCDFGQCLSCDGIGIAQLGYKANGPPDTLLIQLREAKGRQMGRPSNLSFLTSQSTN